MDITAKWHNQPAGAYSAFCRRSCGGDITARPDGEFHAELAEVKDAIETMVDNLKVKMDEADARGKEAAEQAVRAEVALVDAKQQENRVSSLLDQMQHVARQAVSIAQQVRCRQRL